jgi:hypothetical protein
LLIRGKNAPGYVTSADHFQQTATLEFRPECQCHNIRVQNLGTADFQFGRNKFDSGSGFSNAGTSQRFEGYAFTAGAGYKFAPVTVSVDLGYGSDDSKDDSKISTFMTSQSDLRHIMFIYDYMTVNAAGNIAGGLQNTMYAKFGADADVVKGLNVAGSIGFLAATNSRHIGTEVDKYAHIPDRQGPEVLRRGADTSLQATSWKNTGAGPQAFRSMGGTTRNSAQLLNERAATAVCMKQKKSGCLRQPLFF